MKSNTDIGSVDNNSRRQIVPNFIRLTRAAQQAEQDVRERIGVEIELAVLNASNCAAFLAAPRAPKDCPSG